ncbi:hypothetical protein Vi05172_g548 [Venturia inaequalis]|nr:hypothetical protein Vi05172_g548 [Venturia inaequalis]
MSAESGERSANGGHDKRPAYSASSQLTTLKIPLPPTPSRQLLQTALLNSAHPTPNSQDGY